MKRGVFLLVLCLVLSVSLSTAAIARVSKEEVVSRLGDLSVPFIENQGQVAKEVAYYAKTFGGTVFVMHKGEIVYNLLAKKGGVVLKERFLNAKPKTVRGEQRAITRVNYFIGKNRNRWHKNIPTYIYVSLGEIYKGVEVKLKAYGNRVEKLFYIKPRAEVEKLWMKLEGAKRLSVTKDGRLKIITEKGDVYFTKPLAYQEIRGKKRYVSVAYVLRGSRFGFKLGNYDKTKSIIIDPLLSSTFLGEKGDDRAYAIAIDNSGNVFVAGRTYSSNFPTTSGAYDTSLGDGADAFISKLDNSLSTLLASTFLGGENSGDLASALKIDSNDNVYVIGYTKSSDFPTTPGAYDTSFNGGINDAFISKLDNSLGTLLASTFLGGENDDRAYGLAIDSNGNVFVSGCTNSADFPTTSGAYSTAIEGGYDSFISKLSNDLSTLYASTFLGGENDEEARALALDSNSNVFITSYTESSDFPTTFGAYDTSFNGSKDSFISKLSNDLSTLYASTFLGGENDDETHALVIDSNDNVFVAGDTYSADFPTTSGAYSTAIEGGYDSFISKLSNDLSTLYASTFLGGENDDYAAALAMDRSNNVFVAGRTYSSNFPTTSGAYDVAFNGNLDAFISKLSNDLSTLYASTFLGGENDDYAAALAMDKGGNVFITGLTQSSDFPTTSDAYDTGFNGYYDGFVSKFNPTLSVGTGLFHPDFNSDGRTDTTVWRSSNGHWYGRDHETGDRFDRTWGNHGDIPFVGDFDGDNKTDVGVWRDTNGRWYVLLSSKNHSTSQSLQSTWGRDGDIPVPGDYNGDGKTDFGIWRPSNGKWYIKSPDGTIITMTTWGQDGDIPVPGDYNGDGKTDFGIWRPSNGKWYIKSPDGTIITMTTWGQDGDVPVPADFDGDGKTDFGIWRPSNGKWYIKSPNGSIIKTVPWGSESYDDIPIAGDYDADGKADITIWRPSNGHWYIKISSSDFTERIDTTWGTGSYNDLPIGCSPFSAVQRYLEDMNYYP